MTAIVSVLNKHAVAIAADSAVTIGGSKVMNTANKLFALSKYHPVAIAVYGNSELIGTPWEIIIKEYRKQIDNNSFGTLQEYADDFIRFLSHNSYYCNNVEALNHLKSVVSDFFKKLVNIYKKDPSSFDLLIKDLEKSSFRPLNIDFTNKTVDFFNKNTVKEVDEGVLQLRNANPSIDEPLIRTIVTSLFTKDIPPTSSVAGLVFIGYGEKEIFPSVCHYTFGCVIDGVLAHQQFPISSISKTTPSIIYPFAQTDVMMTILNGIAPQIQEIYMNSLKLTFTKFIDALANLLSLSSPILAEQVKHLELTPFYDMFLHSSSQTQSDKYTLPFVNSVASLEKEDLADFAESLITLTSLKRKVSPNQETVGGPVDVMVISKGDGIIWMKRKHYFQPDLNHHFFDNYFNN